MTMLQRKRLIFTLALLALSCDPEGREKCVWTLEPEPDNIAKAQEGMVPLCARNRETMKQDCRLQAPLEFAKSASGKHFRYVDMKVKTYGIPRTIESIEYCN